jgi:hypothetical protein
MKIGVDLDNTLVCYDPVFARMAAERGIVVGDGASAKKSLRDALRRMPDGEARWTTLQGEAYGPGMADAQPYAGARAAIEGWIQSGHDVVIVSHKTRFPALGTAHDLHACGRQWTARWFGDLELDVFLEFTRWLKLRRIESERCDVFVDDLLDVLEEPTFPRGICRVWFAPEASATKAAVGVTHARSWIEVGHRASVAGVVDPGPAAARPATNGRRTGAFTGDPEAFFSAFVARELGSALRRCTPLAGGINNLGARLLLADGREVVGKIYKRSPADPRDRLRHETQFLRLLERAGIDCVPRVLAVDEEAGAALHTLMPGRAWPERVPAPATVWAQFSDFLAHLQRVAAALPAASELPLAAEAALSIQEHLAWVQQRRDLWRARALADELSEENARTVLEDLESEYLRVATAAINHPEFPTRTPREWLVLSPSDFGLHNALVTEDGRVSFVDFEYAGWDDPVKTECDFALQPRHIAGRPDRLAALDGRFDRDGSRATVIRKILALKWRYIVLALAHAQSRSAANNAAIAVTAP